MTEIKPIRDQVVVKRNKADEVSKGGIIIATTAQQKPDEGVVVAVGSGRVDLNGHVVPLEVSVGDRVLVAKHSYQEIKIEGEDYLVLREDAILVVLK